MRRELTKAEIGYMKREVEAHIQLHGGGAAHVKYHKQNQYVEAWIAVYMTDRRIAKVRFYATGDLYEMTTESGILSHNYQQAICV